MKLTLFHSFFYQITDFSVICLNLLIYSLLLISHGFSFFELQNLQWSSLGWLIINKHQKVRRLAIFNEVNESNLLYAISIEWLAHKFMHMLPMVIAYHRKSLSVRKEDALFLKLVSISETYVASLREWNSVDFLNLVPHTKCQVLLFKDLLFFSSKFRRKFYLACLLSLNVVIKLWTDTRYCVW